MTIKHAVNPGITYDSLIPGYLVPLYEEQEALRYANYNYREWKTLEPEEKAFHVAQYRLSKYIRLNADDAVADKMDAEAKKIRKK